MTNLPAPDIRNIRFSNMTIEAEHNIVVQANEGSIVENINFNNIDLTLKGVPESIDTYGYGEWDYKTSSAGFYVANAENVSLNCVNIQIEEENSPISKGIIAQNTAVTTQSVSARKNRKPIEVYEARGVN